MVKMRWLFGLGLSLACSAIGYSDESVPPVYTLTSLQEPSCSSIDSVCPAPSSSEGLNCASTTGCGDLPKLFGVIAPSDHGFSSFISPMTNPVYFEDPRTLTEVRMIFLNHAVPAGLGGGNVQLFAAQARAALTENLSIIATKDGYFTSESPLMSSGWANVNAGLKYNLYKNYCTQTLISTGFTYGIPLGSPQSFQGKGNGEFNMFLSGGRQLGENWHVLSTFGARIPTNTTSYTESTYLSAHLDRKLGNTGFYLFTESNWYHYLSNGNQLPVNFEALDVANLGSTNVAGNDIVTGAYGVKYKTNDHVEVGVAYEIPYTSRHDILQNRLTADLIIRY